MSAFGEFLYALRKENGMTQAELAERLGVTNKAVSKWETGEAMPESNLLLPIARIFGVTVDELLDGKRRENEETEQPPERTPFDEMKEHLFTRGDDEPKTFLGAVGGAVCAFVCLGGIAAYLIIGLTLSLWTPYWVIIPVSALSCGIIGIVFDLCDKEKRSAKRAKGESAAIGGACGILMLSCIITYLLLGAILDLWHPYWIILVCGGLACGIIASCGTAIVKYRKRK